MAAAAFVAVTFFTGAAAAQTAPADPSPPSTSGGPTSGAPAPSGPHTTPTEATAPRTVPASTDGALMPEDPEPRATTPAVDPAADQQKLLQQGQQRPTNDGTIGARPSEVYSEDWWAHTRAVVELHGYFRTRGELFHNFTLGRHYDLGADPQGLWPQPLDQSYGEVGGSRRSISLCGSWSGECIDKTQATANLRLRLNPEIHISDNLRIMSQVDLLDNLVLGSTPDSSTLPGAGNRNADGTYNAAVAGYRNNYVPASALSMSQGSPVAGVNSYQNSISVQRVWAEYLTPVGQLRFGRMPNHWGLGMLYNSGDCLDCDYQTNIDRIMFVTGLKSLDVYFGGSWDFISSGPTNQSPYDTYGGQPYNQANLTNVNQWSAFVARRTNPELQRLKLARNEVVLNGGLYASYRSQLLDVQNAGSPLTVSRDPSNNNGLERRDAEMLIPDLWLQLLWGKFRLEAEAASIWGSIGSSSRRQDQDSPLKLRQFGFAAQSELRAIEDKLRIQFGSGWASGDSNVEGLVPPSTGLQSGPSAMTTFRMHPAYYVDYIFFRRILSRVQGAYYFRPSVEYDFMRNPNGQKFGGGAAIIWSRASEFMQTPGNKRDLGVELDAQVYYQSKDGSLNDDPNKMGGFYATLQYGVFFPLGGLEYLPGEKGELPGGTPQLPNYDLSTAQTVRLILGVMF